MREEHTLEDSAGNPYAGKPCRLPALRLNVDTVAFFKAEAARTGIPYHNLINLYLEQCTNVGKGVLFT